MPMITEVIQIIYILSATMSVRIQFNNIPGSWGRSLLPYRSIGTRPFAGITENDLISVQCAHLLCIKAKIIVVQRLLQNFALALLSCSVSPLIWMSLFPASVSPAAYTERVVNLFWIWLCRWWMSQRSGLLKTCFVLEQMWLA